MNVNDNVVTLPIGRTSPTSLPAWLEAEIEYASITGAAKAIFRFLLPILLRPHRHFGFELKVVAELMGRWNAKVRAASRRYAMWDFFNPQDRATRIVSQLAA